MEKGVMVRNRWEHGGHDEGAQSDWFTSGRKKGWGGIGGVPSSRKEAPRIRVPEGKKGIPSSGKGCQLPAESEEVWRIHGRVWRWEKCGFKEDIMKQTHLLPSTTWKAEV